MSSLAATHISPRPWLRQLETQIELTFVPADPEAPARVCDALRHLQVFAWLVGDRARAEAARELRHAFAPLRASDASQERPRALRRRSEQREADLERLGEALQKKRLLRARAALAELEPTDVAATIHAQELARALLEGGSELGVRTARARDLDKLRRRVRKLSLVLDLIGGEALHGSPTSMPTTRLASSVTSLGAALEAYRDARRALARAHRSDELRVHLEVALAAARQRLVHPAAKAAADLAAFA